MSRLREVSELIVSVAAGILAILGSVAALLAAVSFLVSALGEYSATQLLIPSLGLVVSIIALTFATVWNYLLYKRTWDIYQPGVDIEWLSTPSFLDPDDSELSIAVRNSGRGTLMFRSVTLRGNWFKKTIRCRLDDDNLTPGERTTFSVELPAAHPGANCKVKLRILDLNERTWIRRHKFSVPVSEGADRGIANRRMDAAEYPPF